jgi:hypothetical protein
VTPANNDLGKPWLLMCTHKPIVSNAYLSFMRGEAGVIGGFATQVDANAAMAEMVQDYAVLDPALKFSVVNEPQLLQKVEAQRIADISVTVPDSAVIKP